MSSRWQRAKGVPLDAAIAYIRGHEVPRWAGIHAKSLLGHRKLWVLWSLYVHK